MIVKECRFEPPHVHEWLDDWDFGGANGEDPRADRRWRPATYIYLDERLDPVWITQTPLCDDQAIDEFTKHASLGVMYLQVKRPDAEVELLDWQYDAATDLVTQLGE